MKASSLGLWVGLAFVLFSGSVAEAQERLRGAEEAYAEIDYEKTLEEAQAALEEGDYSPSELARIYELIGMAAAASDDEERSSQAYVRLLALRPDAQVDTNLAPRLRSPFMEARGYWASRSDRLGADVRYVERRGGLRVELTDPVGMAADVLVRTRAGGSNEAFEEYREVARESFLVPVGEVGGQLEYIVEVLDEHGNQLVAIGSEDEPIIVGEASGEGGGGSGATNGGGGIPMWVWIVGGVVVAGAAATGLAFGLRQQPITLQSGVALD